MLSVVWLAVPRARLGSLSARQLPDDAEIKHAAGDDAWWMPGVDDVHNDLQMVLHHVAYDASTQVRQRGMTGESSGRSRKR